MYFRTKNVPGDKRMFHSEKAVYPYPQNIIILNVYISKYRASEYLKQKLTLAKKT